MTQDKDSFAALRLLGKTILINGSVVSIVVCLLAIGLSAWSSSESQIIDFIILLLPVSIVYSLLSFLFIWKNWRKLSYASLLTALIGIGYIGSIGSLFNKQSGSETYEIMSYNIGGIAKIADPPEMRYQFNTLATEILASPPDIIAFQEYPRQLEQTALDAIYPHQQSHFTESGSTYGTKIYSRHPIVKAQAIVFDSITPNNAVACHVQIGSDTVQIINMHLQSTGLNQLKDKLLVPLVGSEQRAQEAYLALIYEVTRNRLRRIEQAKQVNEIISEAQLPVIACGDTNTSPQTCIYKILTTRLHDAFDTAGLGLSPTYKPLFNLFRVDYFLYSPYTINAEDYERMPFTHSDHTCIAFNFSFN